MSLLGYYTFLTFQKRSIASRLHSKLYLSSLRHNTEAFAKLSENETVVYIKTAMTKPIYRIFFFPHFIYQYILLACLSDYQPILLRQYAGMSCPGGPHKNPVIIIIII